MSIRIILAIASMAAILTPSAATAADAAKQQRKAREANAKHLVAAGAQAEKDGKVAEARKLYLDAEAQAFTKDAEKSLERLDSQERDHDC